MRKKIVVANWKMNTSLDEAINLIVDIKAGLGDDCTILCVPFTHIGLAQELVDDRIAIGAQNVSIHEEGPFTGEISGKILNSFGVEYVILGHSERKKYFNESTEETNLKVKIALKNDIVPIICCGETLQQREEGSFMEIIKNQLSAILRDLSSDDLKNCMIAYEPVWAIGTGQSASAAQAQEVHLAIRQLLQELYNQDLAQDISLLYGGSVKLDNAKALFEHNDIDGALVGGSSLNAKQFIQIIKCL